LCYPRVAARRAGRRLTMASTIPTLEHFSTILIPINFSLGNLGFSDELDRHGCQAPSTAAVRVTRAIAHQLNGLRDLVLRTLSTSRIFGSHWPYGTIPLPRESESHFRLPAAADVLALPPRQPFAGRARANRQSSQRTICAQVAGCGFALI